MAKELGRSEASGGFHRRDGRQDLLGIDQGGCSEGGGDRMPLGFLGLPREGTRLRGKILRF